MQKYIMDKDMGVSKNNGTPKSSILIVFSIINLPFWGTPIFGNTHIGKKTSKWQLSGGYVCLTVFAEKIPKKTTWQTELAELKQTLFKKYAHPVFSQNHVEVCCDLPSSLRHLTSWKKKNVPKALHGSTGFCKRWWKLTNLGSSQGWNLLVVTWYLPNFKKND